jgi:hypothetical protein
MYALKIWSKENASLCRYVKYVTIFIWLAMMVWSGDQMGRQGVIQN